MLGTATDRSSHRAADMAMDYAKARAVYIMARKMQVDDAANKVAQLKPEQLHDIVRGATVLQSRRVGMITYLDVTVSVVEEPLRRALGIEEAAPSIVDGMASARGVLVLPVYVGKTRPYLWEKENILDGPVRSEVLRQARGAVLVPAGDFDDRRLVDYQNALEVKAEELEPMFARYGVDEIIVAVVTLGTERTLEPSSILLRRLGHPPDPSRVEEITVKPLQQSEPADARAQDAASAVASAVTQIAGATSKQQQEKLAKAPTLPITFRYATASELGLMQDAVRTAPGVMQLSMPAIALDTMRGVVYLSDEKDKVKQALVKKGLVVKPDGGEGWVISVR